jgi:hypothetical protein
MCEVWVIHAQMASNRLYGDASVADGIGCGAGLCFSQPARQNIAGAAIARNVCWRRPGRALCGRRIVANPVLRRISQMLIFLKRLVNKLHRGSI